MLFGQSQPTTLIVVYKDEMLVNQLKKLVETNDDNGEEIVGVKDGSVDIVAWNEKTWTAQKKAGNITSKVLFLGDIKGVEKLTPIIDEKFNKFGIKFGWAGKQAVIYADSSLVKNHDDYLKFAEELNELPIPESYKYNSKNVVNVDINTNGEDTETTDELVNDEDFFEPEAEDTQKGRFKELLKAKNFLQQKIDQTGNAAKKLGTEASAFAQELKDKKTVETQQMLYGIIKFYYEGIEKFINS